MASTAAEVVVAMLKGSRFPESQAMGPRIKAEGYLLIPILRPFGPAVGGKRCCQLLA